MSVLSNGYLLALTAGPSGIDFNAEFLVIAGGGQHSGNVGAARGGGGAGGYISSISGESSGGGTSALSAQPLTTGTTYTVTVGAAGSNSRFNGTDTSDTAFDHDAIRGGGPLVLSGSDYVGQDGGSGGGGSYAVTLDGSGSSLTSPGGAGTSGQGYGGGAGSRDYDDCGKTSRTDLYCNGACDTETYYGGGGGAGAAGSGINGGNGVQSSVTGTATYYAGGGSGASVCSSNQAVGTAGSGQTNYGGGGDRGAVGQNGVVFLKYPTTVSITNPGGGLTMSTTVVSGNNVTTVTAGTGDIEFSAA